VTAPAPAASIEIPAPPAARRPGYDRGFWGVSVVIATEAMIFMALLASYFFLRAAAPRWPPPGIELPDLGAQTWVFTAVLVGSSIPVIWAEWAVTRNKMRQVSIGLAIAFVMGAAFVVHTYFDFQALHFGMRTNAYGSIFYVTVGLHAAHVVVGLLLSLIVQIKARRGYFDARHHSSLRVFALYWHFVDGVWIFVFSALFLSPHLR
jgi:heme/copper-type cytochrome/quinol oxidase subunit 3